MIHADLGSRSPLEQGTCGPGSGVTHCQDLHSVSASWSPGGEGKVAVMSDMAATKAITERRAMIRRLHEIETEAASIRGKLETGGGMIDVLDQVLDLCDDARTMRYILARWEAFEEIANA